MAATSGRRRAGAVGDLLFSQAFALLARTGTGAPRCCSARPRWRSPAASSRSAATPSTPRSASERYLDRCRLKTARLFECACLIGPRGRRRGAGEEQLRAFGAEIGLAFQLLDDVLDVTGPPERTGKARGTDLLDGTVNLPLILAAAERSRAARGSTCAGSTPAAAEALCDRIAATGVLERGARAGAGDGRRRRSAGLREPAFDAEQRQLLGLVADGVVERYS